MTLRVRLLLVLVAVVAAGLLVSDVVTYTALRSYLYTQVDQQITGVPSQALAREIVECASNVAAPGQCALPPGHSVAVSPGSFAELVQPGGSSFGLWFGPSRQPPKLPNPLPGAPFTASAARGRAYRVLAQTLPSGDTVVLAWPLDSVEHTLGRLSLVEALVSAAVLLGLGVLAWWLVRRGLRPLDSMAATAGAIAAGDLSRRVAPADDHTEVGRLGLALNTMLGEIEGAFAARAASEERLRRFLADASHELRTPLTSIRGYAEMFDRGVRERPEDLAVAMRTIRSEANRMSTLVEDLLLLARLDRQRPLALQPVDLAEVVGRAVDAVRVTAPGRPVALHAPSPAELQGDPDRLRQVVDNLLTNAVAYTPAGSPIDVEVQHHPTEVVLVVADRGPGVAPEDRQRIFEPFHRADPSRTRASGGAGLGLAIVAAIVRAHGGTVGVADRAGGGASFQVRLPTVPALAPGVGLGGGGYVPTAGASPWAAAPPAPRGGAMGDHTTPSDTTRQEQAAEARAVHQADRAATPDEERAAEQANGGRPAPGVAAHEKEMAERGASAPGEGRIP